MASSSTMPIHNIAGYRFISLTDLSLLREKLLAECLLLDIKGTILLAPEGINISLAGAETSIAAFKRFLFKDPCFEGMTFRESVSEFIPFKRLKVKLKKEIITLRQPEVQPEHQRAPALSPEVFKQWLDEQRDITILDTRNDYEISYGTFKNAVNLDIEDFCDFPNAIKKVDRTKPIVMFCTGGVRCEKAGVLMQNAGFSEVYQLEGGILNYFKTVGGAYYEGECFVFDDRVALDAELNSKRN